MKIRINGIDIAYDCYGKGDDIWLSIHGNRDKREYMTPFAKAIASKDNNRKVYNIDLRGHGESDKPDDTCTLDIIIEDIAAFLKEMNIERYSIIGHSLGSTLAVLLYKRHPDMIHKLILISASPYFVPKFRPPDLKDFNSDVTIQGIHEKAVTYMFSIKYPHVIDTVIGHWADTPQRVHKTLLGIKHPDLREDIKYIKVPTLLIYGEDDKSTTVQDGMIINKAVEHSELVVLPGCSHFVILEEPGKVADIIRNFI